MKTIKKLLLSLIFLISFLLVNGQVAIFPHTSSFELGFGDWVNAAGDDFDWSIRSGSSTPSGGTGPQIAPYGALGSNGYTYIESSTPNYPDKQAWLDCVYDFSSLSSPEIAINYHMYAANGANYGPGILQLDIYDGTSWIMGAWSSTVSDPSWRATTIDLSAYAGLPYVILSWTGYTTWWQCDICLDELVVRDGAVFTIDTYPYTQGFDTETNSSTSCCPVVTLSSPGWSNAGGDDCDWSIRDINTPSLNTGPTEDQSGTGKYLYMESSSCYSKVAYLVSPKFDFLKETSPYIQFYYHMYGATIASMKLEWSLDKVQWFGAWSKVGDQGNSWKLGFADLPFLAGISEVYFRIGGQTGTSFTSDMAFDGFSGFGSGVPLPVTLISFEGQLSEDQTFVYLEWVVASQINNNYFEIQRSTDVEYWSSVGVIDGAGNSNAEMTYGLFDDHPVQGVSYYRLKQVDYDGKSETFYPIAMTINQRPHIIDKVINFMGQEVNDNYEGFVIEIYKDGSAQKKYKLNKQ